MDVWRDTVRAKGLIGVLPDGNAMPERLTGREVLTYLGLLRGLEPAVVAERTDELLRVLELDSAAVALLHAPRLLVLDAPGSRREASPGAMTPAARQRPVAPSICSRRMSAWPACRPVSSIMWASAQRTLGAGRPGRGRGAPRSAQPSSTSFARSTASR